MLWCLPLAVPLIAKSHNRFTSPRIQWPYDAMPCAQHGLSFQGLLRVISSNTATVLPFRMRIFL